MPCTAFGYFGKGGVFLTERDLLILKYLKEFGNITKTANALFISQPALTARIKQLEQELGTKLMHSSNKGVYLTPTGLEAAAFADDILRRFDGFRSKIQAIEDEEAGCLKLSAPYIISKYYLPAVITAFRKEHPKVKFNVTVAPSSRVTPMLEADKCNFGFLRNDFGWDGGKHLLCLNYIAAVNLRPFEISDLPHMHRVDYTTDTYYKKMLNLWWDDTFATPPQVDVTVDSLELCKEMVFSGVGFGILPSVFLPECPEATSYILKNKAGKPIERHTWLIYKKDVLNYRVAKQFLEFIKAHDFSDFLQLKFKAPDDKKNIKKADRK